MIEDILCKLNDLENMLDDICDELIAEVDSADVSPAKKERAIASIEKGRDGCRGKIAEIHREFER